LLLTQGYAFQFAVDKADPSSRDCDMTQVSELEAPPQTNTRKTVSSLIFFGVFCWGVFASLSTISKLDFVIDFTHWSVDQAPINFKHALARGRQDNFGGGVWLSRTDTQYCSPSGTAAVAAFV
jgi:hypothetical protein